MSVTWMLTATWKRCGAVAVVAIAIKAYVITLKAKAPKILVNGHWLPGKVKPPKTEDDNKLKRNRDLRWMYGKAM